MDKFMVLDVIFSYLKDEVLNEIRIDKNCINVVFQNGETAEISEIIIK